MSRVILCLCVAASIFGLAGCRAKRTAATAVPAKTDENQVSAEAELAQLKRDSNLLELDATKIKKQLAEEQVSIREVRQQAASANAALEPERARLLAQGEAIKAAGDSDKVTIDG